MLRSANSPFTTAHSPAASDETVQQAWAALEHVPDPEIPVVSIRELGILRDVARDADGVLRVTITPTYSGCPAMAQIAADIEAALERATLGPCRVDTVLAPAWTTDWISEHAREKLRAYGIAPPIEHDEPAAAQTRPIRFVARQLATPACPRCGSARTERVAQFGSTACKALYRCLACREPFDYFKPY